MHSPDTEPPALAAPQKAQIPYLPGLDGLRALAVTAVLIYHAGLGLRGGFLGVEVFFVLSGYLITALLYAEWQGQGRIDLLTFWRRRARRLLPALFAVLAATLALTLLFVPDELAEVGADTLAALVYLTNWWLILGGQPYFDPMLRPPLLQHLWSLAVEEQFYLLWPILFALGMRALGRRALLLLSLGGALASTALMAALYQPGADPSRLYYGTDTRAAGLLLGAALALLWPPAAPPGAARRSLGLALDGAGLLALCFLLFAMSRLVASHPLLYRGGLTAVALATALLIAAVSHPQARLAPRLLGLAPLRWLGTRSYGIYLWHWPIFMLTRPLLIAADNDMPLQALRIALALLSAELCYRWIEAPIRHGARLSIGLRPRLAAVPETAQLIARAQQLRRSARAGGGQLAPVSTRPIWARVISALLIFGSACAAPGSVPLLTAGSGAANGAAGAAPEAAIDRPTRYLPPTPTATGPGPTAASATPSLTAPGAARPTATAQPQARPFDPALAEELQALLDAAVAEGDIPGVVLAVHIPGQQPWSGASGLANINLEQPMEPATNIYIGSISKMFTAVVVLQLVEEGRIALDAPVESYLPDLLPYGERVTVRQLLNHTSGLYDYLEDWDFVNVAYADPAHSWAPEELVGYATGYPLAFQPGAEGAFDYSSTNYVILGMIVERVTGATLAEGVRARIIDPLQLRQTSVAPDEAAQGALATGYYRRVDQTGLDMSFGFATANIVSSAADVQRFADALLAGELLDDDSLAAMMGFIDGHGQYEMPELEYGLGLMRARLPIEPASEGAVVGHIGGFGGFRSAVWQATRSGVTISLGVNQSMTDPNRLATQVLEAILARQQR